MSDTYIRSEDFINRTRIRELQGSIHISDEEYPEAHEFLKTDEDLVNWRIAYISSAIIPLLVELLNHSYSWRPAYSDKKNHMFFWRK